MTDAENTLRDLLNVVVDELDCRHHQLEITPVTSDGSNYTSALFLVTITNGLTNKLHLFAKVACVGDTMRVLMNATKLFAAEAFVYTQLANIYNDIQDKHKVADEDRFIFPKFYGCDRNIRKETILMENLAAKGYKSHNRLESIDWEHAASAVEALAKFHALSFAYQKERPEEFKEVVRKYRYEQPHADNKAKQTWLKMINKSLSVLDGEYREKVSKLVQDCGDKLFETFLVPIGNPVLVHGDYRTSNLLFKQQEGKLHTMVVDFQTVVGGCPAADLVYLEFLGTDARFRAEHHTRLADHYYGQLACALKRLQLDAADVYPRQKFDSDQQKCLPFGVVVGVGVLPVVLAALEQTPRVDGDADSAAFLVQSDERYAERFRGIVADCVRWGAL